MKKYLCFPALALAGGAAAFVLRLQFCRTGFESGTGLPVPGNLYGWGSLLLLAVLAVLTVVLSRKLPDEKGHDSLPFAEAFLSTSAIPLTILVTGIFLLAASGLYDLYSGLLVNASRMEIIVGVLTVLSAACLFSVVPLCRKHPDKEPCLTAPNALLVPVCYLVVRLVLTYRVDSVNPSLSLYYVEILSLVFLTLGFYRLSSFAFQVGRTRRFALYAVCAIILCIATLADGHGLSATLLYAGGAATLLGFLLLRLEALASIWGSEP